MPTMGRKIGKLVGAVRASLSDLRVLCERQADRPKTSKPKPTTKR